MSPLVVVTYSHTVHGSGSTRVLNVFVSAAAFLLVLLSLYPLSHASHQLYLISSDFVRFRLTTSSMDFLSMIQDKLHILSQLLRI